jgi:hypothetical protein
MCTWNDCYEYNVVGNREKVENNNNNNNKSRNNNNNNNNNKKHSTKLNSLSCKPGCEYIPDLSNCGFDVCRAYNISRCETMSGCIYNNELNYCMVGNNDDDDGGDNSKGGSDGGGWTMKMIIIVSISGGGALLLIGFIALIIICVVKKNKEGEGKPWWVKELGKYNDKKYGKNKNNNNGSNNSINKNNDDFDPEERVIFEQLLYGVHGSDATYSDMYVEREWDKM